MTGNKHEPLCLDDEMFAATHGWKRRHLAQKKQIVKPEAGYRPIFLTLTFGNPDNLIRNAAKGCHAAQPKRQHLPCGDATRQVATAT